MAKDLSSIQKNALPGKAELMKKVEQIKQQRLAQTMSVKLSAQGSDVKQGQSLQKGNPSQTLVGRLNTQQKTIIKSGNSAANKNETVAAKLKSITAKDGNRENKQGILSLTIRDRGSLYGCYMPFIKNGGIFIPTDKKYSIGDEVFILLTLTDNQEKLPISGRVVWLSPKSAVHKTLGIGVQFGLLDKGSTKFKIEKQLAGALKFDRPTQTM